MRLPGRARHVVRRSRFRLLSPTTPRGLHRKSHSWKSTAGLPSEIGLQQERFFLQSLRLFRTPYTGSNPRRLLLQCPRSRFPKLPDKGSLTTLSDQCPPGRVGHAGLGARRLHVRNPSDNLDWDCASGRTTSQGWREWWRERELEERERRNGVRGRVVLFIDVGVGQGISIRCVLSVLR